MNLNSVLKLHTGNVLPVIGLGTWQLTDDIVDTVSYAISKGYRMIDTSSDYGTQAGIGEALKNVEVKRKDLYIITKVEETDNAYEATKEYIAEMGLDYADLILIHRPPPAGAGTDLWKGLIKAKEEGFTRDIGVSNYSMDLMEDLISETGEIPVINQIEWSPFGYSDKMKSYCREKNIIIQAYSPLTRTKRLNDENLLQIAKKYNKTTAQILLRWNLEEGVIPIPKANRKKHIDENINIFDFEISEEDIMLLNNFNEHYSSLTALPYL